jgi:hypothetical protein
MVEFTKIPSQTDIHKCKEVQLVFKKRKTTKYHTKTSTNGNHNLHKPPLPQIHLSFMLWRLVVKLHVLKTCCQTLGFGDLLPNFKI